MTKPAIAGLLLAVSCLAVWSSTAANSAEELPAYYSEAQAERGKALYASRCEACHGGSVPENFVTYSTAERFYLYISGSMPGDNPGSMEPEDYADIIAYILNFNGWPAGDTELPPNRSLLSGIIPGDSVHAEAAPAQ